MENVIKIIKINAFIAIFFISCQNRRVDEKIVSNESIKLWKTFESKESQSVYCFDKSGRYIEYYLDIDSTVYLPYMTDVITIPGQGGKWYISSDTLHFQNDYGMEFFILRDKISNDTLLLFKNYYFVDFTPYFKIEKCNCDSLKAKLNLEGWHIIRQMSDSLHKKH
jgi:hypothetical protein